MNGYLQVYACGNYATMDDHLQLAMQQMHDASMACTSLASTGECAPEPSRWKQKL